MLFTWEIYTEVLIFEKNQPTLGHLKQFELMKVYKKSLETTLLVSRALGVYGTVLHYYFESKNYNKLLFLKIRY